MKTLPSEYEQAQRWSEPSIPIYVKRFNALIKNYNQAKNHQDKIELLLELRQYFFMVVNQYPDSVRSESEDFRQVQDHLFQELKREFYALGHPGLMDTASLEAFDLKHNRGDSIGLGALYSSKIPLLQAFRTELDQAQTPFAQHNVLMRLKNRLRLMLAEPKEALSQKEQQELRSLVRSVNAELVHLQEQNPELNQPASSSQMHFAQMIADMPENELAELVTNLTTEGDRLKHADPHGFDTQLLHHNPQLTEFFKNHKVTCLSHGNTLTFKIASNEGAEFTLRLEDRQVYGQHDKALEAAKTVIAPTHLERQVTYQHRSANIVNPRSIPTTRTLRITEYYPNGSLVTHAQNQPDLTQRRTQAVAIYRQMAATLEQLRVNGFAFTDMKNSNWLINDSGQIRVVDTKGFYPAPNGKLRDPSFPYSGFVAPPEKQGFVKKGVQYDADQFHAFILGKNLYQYLTAATNKEMIKFGGDAREYDFSHEVFMTSEGKELRRLIMKLIRPKPEDRMSVADALNSLQKLEKTIVLQECRQLVQELKNQYKIDDPDMRLEIYATQMNERIAQCEKYGDLAKATTLRSELKQQAQALEKVAKFQAQFHKLLTEDDDLAAQAHSLKQQLLYAPLAERVHIANQYLDSAKARSHELLASIQQEGSMGDSDFYVKHYVAQHKARLDQLTDPKEIKALEQRLEDTLNKVVRSPQMQGLKKIIADFYQKSKLPWNSGMRAKADQIVQAIASTPLHERNRNFEQLNFRLRHALTIKRFSLWGGGKETRTEKQFKEIEADEANKPNPMG